MGSVIIKAARDRDLYVEWSSTVDAPTAIGTRAEMLAYLTENRGFDGPADPPEQRLKRADETGSSAKPDRRSRYNGPLTGSWDAAGFIVEQRGWLPRARLAEFLDTYEADEQKAYKLLDPFDDE